MPHAAFHNTSIWATLHNGFDAENRNAGDTEAKGGEDKVRAAEAKARTAEAKAREAEAKAREEKLRAADLGVPPAMPAKAPLQYVTVLPNCVGIRVGQVDICVKGDISFFGIEQFPDKNGTPPSINGGLATASQKNSNSIRGGLLPSSIQLSINTQQAGIDVAVVEAAEPGWGASGRNNGQVIPTLSRPDPDDIVGRHGAAGERFVALLRDLGLARPPLL